MEGEPSIPGWVWSNGLVHISQAPTKAVRLGGGCLTLLPTNQVPIVAALVPEIEAALNNIQIGDFIEIPFP